MKAMLTLTIIIFAACLVLPNLARVQSQDVDSRSAPVASEKLNIVDGHSRNIYSQRNISPHRMMHFGKRPLIPDPPTIFAPEEYDYQPAKYPYLLHIQLERGQSLQPVLEEAQQVGRDDLYSYDVPLSKQKIFGENFNLPNQFNGQKLARLITLGDPVVSSAQQQQTPSASSSSSSDSDNNMYGSPERALPSSNELSNQSYDGNGDKDNNINLNTRSSMQSGARGGAMSFSKAYISNMLYGRNPAPSIPIGVFNKKAEPKGNFHMHFGRK